MQIIVVQSRLYVAAIATTIIGNAYIYALNLIYLHGYCYVYIHACTRYS
jgi:hypothetical protein